jgi:Fe2+ or Zn2+ uptake regulation protein
MARRTNGSTQSGKAQNGNEPADELSSRGLRSTRQRVAVLELLQADRGHPTAFEVHQRLVAQQPNVSHKTVYAILDALVDAGLARRIDRGARAARYEARPGRHDHAYCRVCGRLFDVPARSDASIRSRAEVPQGFQVETIQVTLEGCCARCASGARNEPKASEVHRARRGPKAFSR